jgi:acetyl-CoA carboxylase biotin carboxyl carrier protein
MNENNLMELEIEKDGTRVRLKKLASGQFETVFKEDIVIQKQTPQQKTDKPSDEKPETKLVPIKAPMVGTFYRLPSPDAKAYVEIGQIIDVGQVVCIVEAMKLMNEIKSEVKGKIVEVLVENAKPVEYGQPLFMIEPV